jgi:integration host factor subunit beta
MATVTKREMIDKVAERTGIKRSDVHDVLHEVLDQIVDELRRGNRLEFRDFGVFEVRERAERMAQNPKTLQKVLVPAKRAVKFKVGRMMREKVESPKLKVAVAASPAIAEVKPEVRAKV